MPGVELTGPTRTPEFDVAWVPVHSIALPPLALQEVAPVLDQLSVIDEPGIACALEPPLTNKVTDGCDGTGVRTVTLVELGELVPPGPIQVNV